MREPLMAKRLWGFVVAFIFLFPVLAHAQKPGSFYWGDSDMDGIISGNDYATLVSVYMDNTQDDADLYFGYPQSRYRQDLDGDGLISGADISFLESWFVGDWNTYGAPTTLEWAGATIGLTVGNAQGNSVEVSAISYSSAGAGHWPRTGFGIIFGIAPTSQCASTVQIYGFDPAGGATVKAWRNPLGYDYQPSLLNPELGIAAVKVRAVGCALGSIIRLTAYIPGDMEYLIPGQRNPVRLSAPATLDIEVKRSCHNVLSVEVLPGSTNIEEGATITFQAICTLDDATTVDCTESYCGMSTEWSSTGHLVQSDPPQTFEGLMSFGVGEVFAEYGSGPIIQGGATIYVWDISPPETTIDAYPPDPDSSTTAGFTFSCNETGCSFMCSLDEGGFYFCASPKVYTGLANGAHTFSVMAIDAAGHLDPTPATYAWTVDSPVPDTVITSTPLNPSNTKSATFEFGCNEALCDFECQMDAGSWELCASPKNYTGLSDGSHNFQVRATAGAYTDPTPAGFTWVIDAPPETFITSTPPLFANQTSASFQFSCDEADCFYDCRIDTQGWVDCLSPQAFSGLSEGSHTFKVRAMDLSGHWDPTPATYTWTIDITPPETLITSQPSNPFGLTAVSFDFSCTDAHTPCTFQCKLDSGSTVDCASPATYSGLSAGSHTFQVQGTDAAGNPDPTPASYTWTIDLTPPDTQITNQPSNPTNATGAIFDFTCTGLYLPCTFKCKLDSGSTTDCVSGVSYSGLSPESHTFNVQATDQVNRPDPSPATYSWTIDLTPPNTTITSNPANPTNSSFAQFGFTCSESPATYECQLDGGTWSACTSLRDCPDWISTSATNAPSARYWHNSAVWTGTEMIVWGGYDGSGYLNTGGRYDPATDSWTATSTTNAPIARRNPTLVWTGTHMIAWGGYASASYYSTGGRYNPATDSWTATSTTNDPSAREYHTAVWTGNLMIVWGGFNSGYLAFGGRYDPVGDSWTATSITGVPSAREYHTAVWTGSSMIVWGGYSGSTNFNTGGRYNPVTDSWTATSTTNAPEARRYHTAVWTGTEMIVWAGISYTNTGGRYNPFTNSWTATSTTNAPEPRYIHTAVWTGNEMMVWGGSAQGSGYTYTGGKYAPATDSWTATNTTNAPEARYYHTTAWTGSQMIVWGGRNAGSVFDTGGILGLARGNHNFQVRCTDQAGNADPTPASYNWTISDIWLPTSTASAPEARQQHTAVWTGTEMIVWGGQIGASTYTDTGGRYDPATDSWTATNPTNAPGARYQHTAVWTGTEMIVWGGYNGGNLNTGGRYAPATNSWIATNPTTAPGARYQHTAVWTGAEMIVWGGFDGARLNSGGRYDPVMDSWTATSLTNPPEARNAHTAILTANSMIVWGGFNGTTYINTGGKYDLAGDSWTATSTTNAPSIRRYHTALWSGNYMIVWGGYGNSPTYKNDGGRYDPATDTWTATSTTNAPVARQSHTAVWTGSYMIVWGGFNGSYLRDGGQYHLSSDSWTATSTNNAPSIRRYHSAVWTGSSMIIWGGYNGTTYFNNGARYFP